jgi:hypothetical protein
VHEPRGRLDLVLGHELEDTDPFSRVADSLDGFLAMLRPFDVGSIEFTEEEKSGWVDPELLREMGVGSAATGDGGFPDLMRLAAEQIAGYLESAPVGSQLPIQSSAALCDILERLVPCVLRLHHPEWQSESIDGFFFSSAVKTDEASVELTGMCILIRDQSVTPFRLNMHLSDPLELARLRIRLGEPGGGALGISGPAVTSNAATRALDGLGGCVETVDWVYDEAASAAGTPPGWMMRFVRGLR